MFTPEHQKLLAKYKAENKPTKEEKLLEEILKELGIKYIQQKGFLAKAYTCYIADFYLPKPFKTIIEVDGKYHEDRIFQDTYRDNYFLDKRNIRTIRIKNEELLNTNEVKHKLIQLLHV